MIAESWSCPELLVPLADGSVAHAAGEVRFEPTGTVELHVQFDDTVDRDDLQDAPEISGRTTDGLALVAQDAPLMQTMSTSIGNSEAPPDGRTTGGTTAVFALPECTLSRPSATAPDRRDLYLKSPRLHTATPKFSHGPHELMIRPLRNHKDKRPGLVRAVLSIQSSAQDADLDPMPLLFLLSLAQRCLIQLPMEKAYAGDELVEIRLFANEARHKVRRPLIPRTGEAIKAFLVQIRRSRSTTLRTESTNSID